jgi:hypothetical protein
MSREAPAVAAEHKRPAHCIYAAREDSDVMSIPSDHNVANLCVS